MYSNWRCKSELDVGDKMSRKKLPRNYIAVIANFKTGAGNHGDARKEANRKACRKKITDRDL